jgi:hypothetical protein
MNEASWFEMLWHGDQGATATPETIWFTLLLAFLLGQIVGWVYLLTHTSNRLAKTFVPSLVVLPTIVSLLMMLMSGGLMVAFGLLAVFAVVRFRNVLRDTRDTVFVLWAIIEGMAAGTFRYSTALFGVTAVALVLFYLRLSEFGVRRRHDALLSVEVVGDPDGGRSDLDRILYRHADRWELTGDQMTASQGLVLTYQLFLRDRRRSAELRDEVAAAANLQEVSFVLQKSSGEG